MSKELEKINLFLREHHVMSLATSHNGELSVCNLFYMFAKDKLSFVVASSEETLHIRHIMKNSIVAGSVVLETETVGKIQGVQFRGTFSLLEDAKLEKSYFKRFPYALVLRSKLWQIKVNYFKMTDNRLGFGKKIIFEDSSL
ncbi:pyridoxamine 5'-phosphate oxidase family protein [bacterium]|nr:pyridoxamine 5'-phosphate oxidase family protein [bacterium]MBU1994237.1 pyridoxamine 5'-phosphate oxidase family protein [bacterium]